MACKKSLPLLAINRTGIPCKRPVLRNCLCERKRKKREKSMNAHGLVCCKLAATCGISSRNGMLAHRYQSTRFPFPICTGMTHLYVHSCTSVYQPRSTSHGRILFFHRVQVISLHSARKCEFWLHLARGSLNSVHTDHSPYEMWSRKQLVDTVSGLLDRVLVDMVRES